MGSFSKDEKNCFQQKKPKKNQKKTGNGNGIISDLLFTFLMCNVTGLTVLPDSTVMSFLIFEIKV